MAPPDPPGPRGAEAEAELDARHVEELLRSVGTAIRSFRLYGGESPMLARFVEALRQKLTEIFEEHSLLRLEVEEHRILWAGKPVYPTGAEGSELAFLFYKDGIRELTLLDGFQDEVPSFLAILGRAPQVKEEEDDLVTLLWAADLAGLRYDYVEPGQEGLDLGSAPPAQPEPVEPEAVRSAAREEDTSLTTEDFQETLYFLDEAELRTLAGELEKERARDLDAGVLTALYDRLEDGPADRQVRIVRLLGEFLPSLLAGARFDRCAEILRELVELASRGGLIAPAALREIRQLFSILSVPETVEQLVDTLEEQPDVLHGGALGELLGFFPPEALAPLMRATSRPMRPDVKRALEQAVDRLAEANREEVVKLLSDADEGAVASALQWVGRLGIGAATSEVTRLLGHPQPVVRSAAVETLQELRAAAAARSLVPLLHDSERDVRVAACRALAALEYAPAREALEAVITGKELRGADRTEKVAFFEAFGRLAGGDGVALLDRTLNGRSWLGRGESSELRACAALALGRVRHPAARTALESAAGDSDPVVRTAVARALRGETQG